LIRFLGWIEINGANGDVEDGLLRGKETDAAGVDAAWRGLDLGEQLHGADFGCAGDGAAGEKSAKDLLEADVGAELATDG
jgi:hypothetical protein